LYDVIHICFDYFNHQSSLGSSALIALTGERQNCLSLALGKNHLRCRSSNCCHREILVEYELGLSHPMGDENKRLNPDNI
ncbi:hypothetical protein QTO17_12580, partial [Vibrio owensii]